MHSVTYQDRHRLGHKISLNKYQALKSFRILSDHNDIKPEIQDIEKIRPNVWKLTTLRKSVCVLVFQLRPQPTPNISYSAFRCRTWDSANHVSPSGSSRLHIQILIHTHLCQQGELQGDWNAGGGRKGFSPFGQTAASASNAAWSWQQVLPEAAAASTLQSSDTCSWIHSWPYRPAHTPAPTVVQSPLLRGLTGKSVELLFLTPKFSNSNFFTFFS